jgi:hypothetical protein
LDLYLTGAEEGFAPPAPFDLVEMEPNEQANRIYRFAWGEVSFAELQLYNLRHVQEHGAQLCMFFGQQTGKPTNWVAQAR